MSGRGLWSLEEEWAAASPGPSESCPVGSEHAKPGGPTEGGGVGRGAPGGAGTGGGPGLPLRRGWWASWKCRRG